MTESGPNTSSPALETTRNVRKSQKSDSARFSHESQESGRIAGSGDSGLPDVVFGTGKTALFFSRGLDSLVIPARGLRKVEFLVRLLWCCAQDGESDDS